jgi:hypothetical protein
MAGKADLIRRSIQKIRLVGNMTLMTSKTFSFHDRFMEAYRLLSFSLPLLRFFWTIAVTLQTENLRSVHEQGGMRAAMRHMTCPALSSIIGRVMNLSAFRFVATPAIGLLFCLQF